ncbi:MAG: hypothetical protein GDA49_06395 [Rhodospirillales bacterium]|nr:hypothetical protein [Rhodospirillales bacterium]
MSGDAVAIVKDMAITVKDFFRLLPRALDGEDYTVDGHRVDVNGDGRHVVITITPSEPRRIALVVIERCEVSLTFTGHTEESRDAFLFLFDRAYRRGGG